MDLICCLCDCCFADSHDKRQGVAGICFCIYCCYEGYRENIFGHEEKMFRFLNIVLILILSIVAVILSSINNWKQGVLLDIQISTQCPSNYEIISVYELPGTYSGCVCLEDKELFYTDCSDWQQLTGCYNFKSQSSIFTHKWVQPSNNSYQAVQICGKRSQLKFYDLLQNKTITEEDRNKNGYKVCQTQNPDNFYCVLQDESCPIREFKISQNQLSDYELRLNNYSLIFDNGFYAYTSQSSEITPLINMIITKGKGVCFDQTKISLNPKLNQDYLLLNPTPENCEIDDTYLQIAKTNEKAFLSLNNIENQINQERPLYEISDTIEYQLLAQNQIYYNMECRRDNFEQIISLGQRFDSQNTLITFQSLFACMQFCIMVFFAVSEVQPCIQKECKFYLRIFIVTKETSIYLVAITVIVSYSYMIDLVLNLKEQNSRNCFLNTSQMRMTSVYDTLNGTSLSLSYCLLINMGIMIIIDVIMITYQCYKIFSKKKRFYKTSKIENQQNNNNNNNLQQQDQIYNQNEAPFQNQQQPSNQYCSQTPFMQQQNYQKYPKQIQYGPTPKKYNYQFQPNHIPQKYVGNQIYESEMIQQEQKANENNVINLQGDGQVIS